MKFSTIFKRKNKHEVSMRDKFIFRVLMPPFSLLIIIGVIFFWQFNSFMTDRALDELRVAAQTTAIRLEREIAIRQTVLENTSNEIAEIKETYTLNLQSLENNRVACREYYSDNYTFIGSPGDACDEFAQSFSRPSLALIEDEFINNAKELQNTEITSINQRLSAYKQFFPETIAIMVTGKDKEILSFAASGDSGLSADEFAEYGSEALDNPIKGEISKIGRFTLAVFAFPTNDGSVLAAYDVRSDSYIRPSWNSTPIDTDEAVAIIAETGNNIVYPSVRNEVEFLSKTKNIEDYATVSLSDVENIVVAERVGDSKWSVYVASPEAIVFEPLRDTQLAAIVITGLLVIGFLWVGSFFIKKTTDNLAHLVTGAMVYSTGRLDYKMNIDTSEKEFRQLAETLQYMAQRIAKSEKENDERNKEFISIATHELRAPMTSIIGYLSMLKENAETKLNKQDKMLLNTAYDGTIRLKDLVNDMLDAARLEGDREEFTISKLAISDYIDDCLESMKIVADESKIKLKYDDAQSDNVFADESKLKIILNNFVSNAIKYNHKNGKVEITHIKHKGELVTAIANTGPTIPADQQEHMFEKFFRVDTPEHKKITGTGIGMYVTKQYVEAMGGKVWFSSLPGQDTIFYFSLPIAGSGKESVIHKKPITKSTNSKWIMRWRKRLQ